MGHQRKGQLTTSGEYAKHLRPDGRREFWHSERRAEDREIQDQIASIDPDEYANDCGVHGYICPECRQQTNDITAQERVKEEAVNAQEAQERVSPDP